MTHQMYATGCWPVRQRSTHTPARRVVARTGGIIRCHFPSRKANRMVACEQLLERDALYLFEFSSQVKAIREQPFRFSYADGVKVRRYTPDFELTLSDGSLLVVEVKPTRSFAKPEIQQKLAAISDAMIRQGHRFLVLTDEVIRAEPRLGSLKTLFPYLCQPVSTDLRWKLRDLRQRDKPVLHMLMKDLIEHIGSLPDVLRLLAHGLIETDCSQPIDQGSRFSLFPEEVDHVDINWL